MSLGEQEGVRGGPLLVQSPESLLLHRQTLLRATNKPSQLFSRPDVGPMGSRKPSVPLSLPEGLGVGGSA